MAQRGSIPEELLRPRKEEAPRYPIDTVIGELGQGKSPQEAYEVAKKTAAALLEGNMDAAILSPVSKAFLENCMTMLAPVNPRSFRLGGGREEPDGSVSFLVRFIGREQGITGELYIRLEQPRLEQPNPQPVPESHPTATDASTPSTNSGTDSTTAEPEAKNEDAPAESESKDETVSAKQIEPVAAPEPRRGRTRNAPAANAKVWLFEDLILEEPRTREVENSETRHRFDFPPYERFF